MRYPLIDGEVITVEEAAAFYEWKAANSDVYPAPPEFGDERVPFDYDRYNAMWRYAVAAQCAYESTQNL